MLWEVSVQASFLKLCWPLSLVPTLSTLFREYQREPQHHILASSLGADTLDPSRKRRYLSDGEEPDENAPSFLIGLALLVHSTSVLSLFTGPYAHQVRQNV